MGIREIIAKAHAAQIKTGRCIPVQLALFPPRLVPWDGNYCTDCGTSEGVEETDDDPLCLACQLLREERAREGAEFNYEMSRDDLTNGN